MVKAYTPQDKIVQQGYNDIESFVGLVIKYPQGGSIEISTLDALTAAGASPISVGQVAAYICDVTDRYDTYNISFEIIDNPASSGILDKIFQAWSDALSDQWIVIRRFESTSIVNPASASAPVAILYKMVADAYLSPVAP
jgi:hypothetical protein